MRAEVLVDDAFRRRENIRMSILEIRIAPDPILRKKARPVKRVDDSIRKLARDMIETMQEASGVGLAANQVGVLKRVVTIQLPEEEPRVFVNRKSPNGLANVRCGKVA